MAHPSDGKTDRRLPARGRLAPLALILFYLASGAGAVPPSFSLPAATFSAKEQLQPLTARLAAGSFADAAALLDTLLNDDGDKLMTTPDGGLLSVAAWVETLPVAQRASLAAAYHERFDSAVRARLELLRHNPSARPEELYTLARRYRFSASGAFAYALAADRAIELGDLPAAHALYQLAMHGGWIPDDTRAARIELLRRLDEGKISPLFTDAATQPAEPSSIPRAARTTLSFAGPMPFDAAWFNNLSLAGQPRYFPAAGDDKMFFTSPRYVLAMKESGQLAWSALHGVPINPTGRPAAPPPRTPAPTRPPATPAPPGPVAPLDSPHRPPLFAPAILSDVYGRAQILVARQAGASAADGDFCLRAFRATDGKPLWSTENRADLKDLSFAGTPAICGQYTYAVAMAVDPLRESATLALAALDTLTGQLRWQATLGSFRLTRERKEAWGTQRPWDDVWEQSEPLVAGDAVYVAPNSGVVAAVGRFEGKTRWIRAYPMSADDVPRPPRSREDFARELTERHQFTESMRGGGGGNAEPIAIDPALGERFRGTPVLCGSVLIAAPQDSAMVFAFDAATGRPIWSVGDVDAPTLIGQTPTTAIFAGETIAAVEARSGQMAWTWKPAGAARVTGPAVMKDHFVLVPTSGAIVILHAEDGVVARESFGVPVLRRILNGEAPRKALEDAGAVKAFGIPPAP